MRSSIVPSIFCASEIIQILLILLLLAAAVRPVRAEGRDEKAVADLVEELVSRNQRPQLDEFDRDATPTYPSDYDKAAQERVMAAWDTLMERGVDAFPELIEHIEDSRYSCTIRPDRYENLTVGDVCYKIINAQLGIYSKLVYSDVGYLPSFLPDRDEMKGWWRKRQGKTLRDLQIEAVRWAVSQQQNYPYRDYDPKERAANLTGLDRLLEHLKASDGPIRVNRRGHFLTNRELEHPVRDKK